VATASSGEDAIATVEKVRPDLCLVDLRLPGISGPLLIEQLLAKAPDTKVVILTVHGEKQDLAACLVAGATGYLSKDSNPAEDLEPTMHAVMAGKIVVDFKDSLLALMSVGLATSERAISESHPTTREREVLECVADGLSNRDIGKRLNISEQTVKNTLANAMRKLRAPNRTAAAMLARDEGFIR
jgi:DNA-binding NarL/FixJ family response regulator